LIFSSAKITIAYGLSQAFAANFHFKTLTIYTVDATQKFEKLPLKRFFGYAAESMYVSANSR